MTQHFDCLIVGAGHAGAETAIALRQSGFAGTIGLLGAEPVAPYERPAISKEYLAGTKDFEQLLLRPAEFWAEQQVTLRLGRRATAVDPAAYTVTCDDHTTIGYGALVWAAGGNARTLSCPGHDLDGVRVLRTKADCDQFLNVLPHSRHIAVIGGGFIGLEAAAVLRQHGKQVAVIETLDRVLARVTVEPVSRFFEAEHRSHGVEVHLGAQITEVLGRDRTVSGIRLTDGRVIPADQVIVGIGIEPVIQPLVAAGAQAAPGGTGVLVDDLCRTSLADVYCVGDCTVMRGGPGIRIESRHNATEQAHTAGKAISGAPRPLRLLPWFWSHQYDLRMQMVGLTIGYDRVVVRGDPGTRSFSVIYLNNGSVIALDCINAPRDYVQGRRLVEAGVRIDPARLADTRTPLKELAATAT